ncbi:MAG: porin OmpL1 [Anaerolineaceae bacterium]
MKKYLFILLALAVALSFGAPAMAKQGLSVGFGLGLLPNAGSLGATIVDDGLGSDIADPFLGGAYNTLNLVEAEDSLSDQYRKGQLSSLETNGPMSAMNIALQARYDAFNYFFARLGFGYSFKASGGETTWKKTGSAYKQSQTWDYSDWSIPLTIGINVPVAEGKVNVYLGFTLAYMSGEWTLELKRNYMSDTAGAGTGVGENLSAAIVGGVKETVGFQHSGIGMGYLLGVDAEVYENVNIFIELDAMVATGMEQYDVENATFRAFGITKFNKYTVIGGQYMRFGAKYNLGFAM